jgi:hypothetical protein
VGAALISEGVRNVTLTSYAGSLRARGFTPDEILRSLQETNRAQCDPPLPDIEVRNVAKSAAKWKPYPTVRRDRREFSKGCFDPRAAVCGFDAADIVAKDISLRLKRRHKLLFGLLRDFYGPLGCHPAQNTLAEGLLTTRQQIGRNILRLVRAGLIQVEAGAYTAPGGNYPCNSYHFPKHRLFREHFRASIPNGFSEIQENMQQFSEGEKKSDWHFP